MPDGYLYLGHNQAPTSTERKWQEHNSHPFVYNNWVVAHNGVLTNYDKLKETYIPEHTNIVDSSIIPALLLHFENLIKFKGNNSTAKEVHLISFVLGLLEGTFGVWIVNLNTLKVYIARQGSTLFFDKNSFTSCKGSGYKEVKEGTIYKFNKKGFKSVGEFKTKSPFLEL